jgi:hypothetical protein
VNSSPMTEPFSKAEILRDLEAVRDWSRELWRPFEAAAFFAPLGEAWSPADNVRHLVKSNRPVALTMGLPQHTLRDGRAAANVTQTGRKRCVARVRCIASSGDDASHADNDAPYADNDASLPHDASPSPEMMHLRAI